MATRSDVGAWGEAIAAKHLADKGYALRNRNWRHGHGELDLIAEHNGDIVFVEVRTRRSHNYGAPEETLTPRKRATLIATAQAYLDAHGLNDVQWQIDVIAIDLDAHNTVVRLDHIECAIEMPSE
jgi:putative endonuclease